MTGSVDSQTQAFPIPGRYRHYKGAEYQVLGHATHSETEETLVLYRALYGEHGLWVRPETLFLEPVSVNGAPAPRFELIEAAAPDEISITRQHSDKP